MYGYDDFEEEECNCPFCRDCDCPCCRDDEYDDEEYFYQEDDEY
jgi:hypothetical protein